MERPHPPEDKTICAPLLTLLSSSIGQAPVCTSNTQCLSLLPPPHATPPAAPVQSAAFESSNVIPRHLVCIVAPPFPFPDLRHLPALTSSLPPCRHHLNLLRGRDGALNQLHVVNQRTTRLDETLSRFDANPNISEGKGRRDNGLHLLPHGHVGNNIVEARNYGALVTKLEKEGIAFSLRMSGVEDLCRYVAGRNDGDGRGSGLLGHMVKHTTACARESTRQVRRSPFFHSWASRTNSGT